MLTAPPTTHPGYDEDADALAGPRGEAGAVGSRLKLIDFGLSVFCTGARRGSWGFLQGREPCALEGR